MRSVSILLSAAFALGACASPQSRVETALVQAGVRASMATCMARRITDRLSIAQLQKLSRVRGEPGEKVGDLSISEVLARVNRIDDPEVVSVVTTSGAACALTS